MSPQVKTPYRPDIDGLRAVAVLAVIAFHAGLPGFGGGFTGVDVFFVLSGYLISGIVVRALENGSFTFRDFYARRINRIFPALIVVLAGTCLLGWYLLFRSEFLSLGKHIASGAAFLSNAALVRETGYFDVAAEKKPLLHLWSLAIEEQFYLFWPLLLAASWRYKTRFAVPAIAIGVASYILAIAYAGDAASFYLPFTRLWELVAGFALFYAELRERVPSSRRAANVQAWLGLALVGTSIFFIDSRLGWPGPWTLVPVLGTVLLISAGGASWANRKLLSHPALVAIGLISYPLYLWHWPLLAFARFIQPRGTGAVLLGTAVAMSFILAAITYRFVEIPIRSRTVNLGRRSLFLVALLAGVGLLGGFAGRGEIPTRLDSPEIRSIQEALIDWGSPEGGFEDNGTLRENRIPGSSDDTVLFAGDSHMEQYWPRMDSVIRAVAPKPTAVFMTVRACPAFPGVGRIEVPECDRMYASIIERAKAPGIKTVVITSYWDDFFRRRLLYRLGDGERIPLQLGDAATDSMFQAFEHDIAALVGAGKKVFVVLTIPIGANNEFDPRSWLPDRLHPRKEVVVAPTIDKGEYLRRTAPVSHRVRAAAARGGAIVLDPVEYLCIGATCARKDSVGKPLYMDGRHLRASVARARALWMDATLK